jgi:SAM-dependent methyltransferase
MASRADRAMAFGSIANEYDRLRPGPPEVALDWLLPAHGQVAVDVGAGTGLLTRELERKVARVVAIEPDERMRAVLRARSPGVEVLAGRGEAIPLPDASADGVFVASAWHWMDPGRAIPEVARVLRDGGRFGVLGTNGNEIRWLRTIGPDREPTTAGSADDAPTAGEPGRGPARRGPGFQPNEMALPAGAPFENVATESFTFTRTMTIDTLIGLLGTYSGVITAGPRDRENWLAQLRATLEEQFPDARAIEVPMRTRCWRADRTARTR